MSYLYDIRDKFGFCPEFDLEGEINKAIKNHQDNIWAQELFGLNEEEKKTISQLTKPINKLILKEKYLLNPKPILKANFELNQLSKEDRLAFVSSLNKLKSSFDQVSKQTTSKRGPKRKRIDSFINSLIWIYHKGTGKTPECRKRNRENNQYSGDCYDFLSKMKPAFIEIGAKINNSTLGEYASELIKNYLAIVTVYEIADTNASIFECI